jgi:hypothetical protein
VRSEAGVPPILTKDLVVALMTMVILSVVLVGMMITGI